MRGSRDQRASRRQNQVALFRHRDELRRRHHAALRMLPAHQRFHAGDAAIHIDLRLVVQHKFAIEQGAADIGFHLGAL